MSNMTGIAKMLTVRKNSSAKLGANPMAELITQAFPSDEEGRLTPDFSKLKSLLDCIMGEVSSIR
jgi:hypothetical protein